MVRTLEEVPEGATHRSKRELAKRVGISPTSVHRTWRAFGLQPWRTEDFKIYPDPLPIDKVRDVIGVYLARSANAAVFAVDEKPPGSRSPPCAHHDPLCAMQTREWTSTRTIQNGGSRVQAITSDRDAALPLLKGASDPIAEYLLVLPPGRARLPTPRTASYGHQLAYRLQWHMFTLPVCSSTSRITRRWPTVRPAPWTVDGV